MARGTTQKTEDFEVRKNWVLGCVDLYLGLIITNCYNHIIFNFTCSF